LESDLIRTLRGSRNNPVRLISEEIMNTQSRMLQRIGGLGVVYGVLFAAAYVLIGNTPSTGASAAAVVKYYHSHRVTEMAGVFVVAAAVLVFSFFISSLRRTLSRTDEGRQLSSIVTAGGAIYVTGLLLMGALTVALVDCAKYGLSSAAQTLNVLSSDAWVPVVVGISILALATGIAGLRSAALPRWLAWVSVALGILAVAGPLGGIAFLVTPVWGIATGIVLLRSSTPDELGEMVQGPAPAVLSNA
jgi:hypothetical protein